MLITAYNYIPTYNPWRSFKISFLLKQTNKNQAVKKIKIYVLQQHHSFIICYNLILDKSAQLKIEYRIAVI